MFVLMSKSVLTCARWLLVHHTFTVNTGGWREMDSGGTGGGGGQGWNRPWPEGGEG